MKENGEYAPMSSSSDELTPINVVPHFSRLQEWIALEERYFRDEGLEPRMLNDVMHSISSHRGMTEIRVKSGH